MENNLTLNTFTGDVTMTGTLGKTLAHAVIGITCLTTAYRLQPSAAKNILLAAGIGFLGTSLFISIK